MTGQSAFLTNSHLVIHALFFFTTEIRELDSERQSLVYNHHSDLIAASDTIGAVSRYI